MRSVDQSRFASLMESDIEVEIVRTSDPSKVTLGNRPLIIRGLPIGPCAWLWNDIGYLKRRIPADKRVTVHVCPTTDMNFLKKNFMYKTLPFHTFLDRSSSAERLNDYFVRNDEKYYLRALGDDPRKEAAMFEKHFPELAPDVHIPNVFPKERLFSTVFRGGSAGVRLWTHYDIMDNILIQIVGRKTVVLFDPSDAPYLYLNGDKSEVIDVDNPDLMQYPLFINAKRYRARMVPGDVLYIPALWFHNVVAEDFSLAVNAFWRSTTIRDDQYDTKDVYGNSDLLPAQRAFQGVEKAIKQLEELPERYRRFYAFRCMDSIRKKFQLPRDVFISSDGSIESLSGGEQSSTQSQIPSAINNSLISTTTYKPGPIGGMPSPISAMAATWSDDTPNQSFGGVIGQERLSRFGPSTSNIAPMPLSFSVPPPPLPATAASLFSASGMARSESCPPASFMSQQSSYSSPSFSQSIGMMLLNSAYANDGIQSNAVQETTDFTLPSAIDLPEPPASAPYRHMLPTIDLTSGVSAMGFGNLPTGQQYGSVQPPQRREKKVLRFINPITGKDSFDEGPGETGTPTVNQDGPAKQDAAAAGIKDNRSTQEQRMTLRDYLTPNIGEADQTAHTVPNDSQSATDGNAALAMATPDVGTKNDGDGDGEMQETNEGNGATAPKSILKYDREFMYEASKFPKSNIKPDFPMVRWSVDGMAAVFDVSKKPGRPRVRSSRGERRRKSSGTASPVVEPKPKSEANAERKSSAPAITGDAAAGTSGVPIGTGATGLDKDTGPKMGTKGHGKGNQHKPKKQASADHLHSWIDELVLDPYDIRHSGK